MTTLEKLAFQQAMRDMTAEEREGVKEAMKIENINLISWVDTAIYRDIVDEDEKTVFIEIDE